MSDKKPATKKMLCYTIEYIVPAETADIAATMTALRVGDATAVLKNVAVRRVPA